MRGTGLDRRIEAVREFNRFYTRRIGVLREGLLESPFNLTEARVIYELAHRDTTTASDLAGALGLDPGYLSRVVGSLKKRGVVEHERSGHDARQLLLRLTGAGRDAFSELDSRSRRDIRQMLEALSDPDQERLVDAMTIIEALLEAERAARGALVLRPHEPGDMGWVVQRHAVLYAREYGWDETFEALVAEIAASFLKSFDPRRERCWMAEVDNAVVGSVCLVRVSDEVAKLRLLIVEPHARGLGIGRRLAEECIRFARRVGYRSLELWTNRNLVEARRLYQALGFVLVNEEPHHSFGKDLVGENWTLDLGSPPPDA